MYIIACICSADTCIIFFWVLGVAFFKGSKESEVGVGAEAVGAVAASVGAATGLFINPKADADAAVGDG